MFDLDRFVAAQAPVYARALGELRAGRKQSHWMWFVFPQIAGLGHSATAQNYAIESLEEARAYVEHPILGPRLIECTEAVLAHRDKSAEEIFGYPDWMKFLSSMTLFELASCDPCFADAIEAFFGGERDSKTLTRLH